MIQSYLESNIIGKQAKDVQKLKILTWNLRHGGSKKKVDYIIQSLIFHNADVIVLTEFRNNENGNKIKLLLKEYGWYNHTFSNPPENENGLLIVSKIPFNVPSFYDYDLPKAEHRWSEIFLNDYDLTILGVHIPTIKDKWDKKNHWEVVIQYAKAKKENKCIIIGDFNTGLKEDCEGAPFRLTEYMEELNSIGWIDSWRLYNPKVNDFTWYSNVKNGFRLDYAYLSPALADNLLVSYHSHKERINKYSDHSILISEILI